MRRTEQRSKHYRVAYLEGAHESMKPERRIEEWLEEIYKQGFELRTAFCFENELIGVFIATKRLPEGDCEDEDDG